MYPTKKLWEIVKISKWKKVNYQDENWKYNYIDIWILRTWKVEQFTNDEWVFCKKEDILIAWDGSKSGTVGFWLEWVIGSTLAKITIDTKMFSSEFIGKFLQGNFDYLNKNTSGAAIPHLRKDILINLEIPLPPLPTQQKIVVKLDSLFEKLDQAITLTKQNLVNIEELNKSILEKIFKECEEKYEKRKLGEIIILNYWKSAEKNENWLYDVYWANWVMYKSDKFLFDWESIIVWRKWSAGALNKVNWRFWASDVTYFVVTNENINYIFNWLKLLNISSLAKWVKPWINRNDVYDLFLPLPPLGEQQKIVEYLDNIFAENQKLKNLYQAQIKNLDEMKQSFLKKAFAGDLV